MQKKPKKKQKKNKTKQKTLMFTTNHYIGYKFSFFKLCVLF